VVCVLSALGACSAKPDAGREPGRGAQDIRTVDLALDLGALTGYASLEVVPEEGEVVLDVSGLDVSRVVVDGEGVAEEIQAGTLRIPTTEEAVRVDVDYAFPARTEAEFDGWIPDLGVSFIWPEYCGNLYPCSPSPVDGITFTMDVTGYDPSLTAIFPTTSTGDAPPYQPAVAVGTYSRLDLGVTSSGTSVVAWYMSNLENAEENAVFGTSHLTAAVDFFETTYGPYSFGPEMGSVQVDWGGDSWGGMEHHPYFHVGQRDFWNEETQVHEAAHGWFGAGVRLGCWEDFVLSEGTVTYMTGRAMDKVDGPNLWPVYVDNFLAPICEGSAVNTIVMPEGCGEIDFESSDLWSLAPYMKGACFYEDVADLVGADVVDAAIADYYQAHVGSTGRMREMIETLKEHSDPSHANAIDTLVTEWLLTEACPADYSTRCRAHN
jgi:aminopeptidase N